MLLEHISGPRKEPPIKTPANSKNQVLQKMLRKKTESSIELQAHHNRSVPSSIVEGSLNSSRDNASLKLDFQPPHGVQHHAESIIASGGAERGPNGHLQNVPSGYFDY